jgi:hypothetical protein
MIESSVDLDDVDAQLLRRRDGRLESFGDILDTRRLTARRWAVMLPADMPPANLLVVSAGWAGGSAVAAAGLRARCGS